MERKRTHGENVLPSIDSSETRRLKEEFLGGIEELDDLRLGTDVNVWMPPEVEDNISRMGGVRTVPYDEKKEKMTANDCNSLKRMCTLFPRSCYLGGKQSGRVAACRDAWPVIPYDGIIKSIRSMDTLDEYMKDGSWGLFFNREVYEYLMEGIELLGILDEGECLVDAVVDVFTKRIPEFEMEMSMGDLLKILRSNKVIIHELYLDILQLVYDYYYNYISWRSGMMPKGHGQRSKDQIREHVLSVFLGFLELFTLGNEITRELQKNHDFYGEY
tara:strand:- start:14867 stop:15685 length:819 start_codon:yes stop_codon:yes gene_type:complete